MKKILITLRATHIVYAQMYLGSTKQYEIPPPSKGIRFSFSWCHHFTWLEYSPRNDSAYCFYCRPFSSKFSDLVFISTVFRQWWKASCKAFPKHERSVAHEETCTKIACYKLS